MARLPFLLVPIAFAVACGGPTSEPDASRIVERDAMSVMCAALGSRGAGDRCACAADCGGSGTCQFESSGGYPGGVCGWICELGGTDCEEGADCLEAGGPAGPGLCFARCSVTADCALGRVCDGVHCALFVCQADSDCENGGCDPYSGLCRPESEGLGLNALCAADEDCRSRVCNTQGRCVSGCSLSRQGCPDGAACIQAGDTGGDWGVCASRCMRDGDCSDGLVCRTTTTPTATVRVCALP